MKRSTVLPIISFAVWSFPALAQLTLNSSPSRVIGQPSIVLSTLNPNLVEGRELYFPQGVAVDMSAGVPGPVYVADTLNNRVLAWKNSLVFRNGALADAVIGQRDLLTTFAQGPSNSSSRFSSGLDSPSGLAVDSQGNVFVADAGNNRILRFPRPFDQKDPVKLPDKVIGQTGFSTATAGVSASALTLSVSGTPYRIGLAFDASGNLWVSDPPNNRVLRFPAASVNSGANGVEADLVLGQPDFTTNKRPAVPAGTDERTQKEAVVGPSGIALDQSGRLFVADALNRVLVFVPEFRIGQRAARVMGVIPIAAGVPPTTGITNVTLGLIANGGYVPPEGVFAIGNSIFVLDTPNSRIMQYDPYDQWPAESSQFSPLAKQVFGQNDFITGKSNRGQPEPSASTLNNPVGAAVAGSDVFVADSANNRVLAFRSGALDGARGVLGQDDFPFNAPNLIEGREFFLFTGFAGVQGIDAIFTDSVGMVVDTKSNPPALYVADPYNNRVLGFRDARKVRPGDRADLVIGQGQSSQFSRALINFPSNDPEVRGDQGLYQPTGVAIDQNGDVWVADYGNSRVLRFPRPFANINGVQRANLVIGQPNFTTKLPPDPTATTLARPMGITFTAAGHLLVSDASHNRVLFYFRPSGDFSNGQAADKVFGQPDFSSSAALVGASMVGMAFPHGIAVDVDDRLYVADTGNNRILIWDRVPATPGITQPAAYALTGVSSPHAVAVSFIGGEIWVADTRNNRVVRYPSFFNIVAGNQTIEAGVPAGTPVGLAVDGFGNVLVAENSNRISLYFPGVQTANAASYTTRPLSPGQIASIFPKGTGFTFGDQTLTFNDVPNGIPLPKELNDVAVTLDDKPLPMYFVAPGQINFLMPMSAPESGTGELQVIHPSTQQIIAASTIGFGPASPALFTANSSGSGQVSALNILDDGSFQVNSAANPQARSKYVSFYGTGQGAVPNAPPDGAPAPLDRLVQTSENPVVIMGTRPVPVENVTFSGLAPGLIGVWQINVKIPDFVAPGPVLVVVVLRSIASNIGPDGKLIVTTIAVKQ